MTDIANAFVEQFTVEGRGEGPLSGLTLGVKDLFDIAGHVTGCGNPRWAATHPTATETASAVSRLVNAGARVVGKTITDELAFSLMGNNHHYGTPLNTKAPDRVPGGSSCGSAAAVAAGDCDIAIGSDTGGSVRAPASFCGLWGLRPSHGVIPCDRVMPLAPSFDTVGWFARDLETHRRVAEVYGLPVEGVAPTRILIPSDSWGVVSDTTRRALAPALEAIEEQFGAVEDWRITTESLDDWLITFRICQPAEIWEVHGRWIDEDDPQFGPGMVGRFQAAKALDPAEVAKHRARRPEIIRRMVRDLADGSIAVLPTVPGAAPLLSASQAEQDEYRERAMRLLCPSGLAGLPQLTMPVATVDGAPLGLSLMGARGSEGTLYAMAAALCRAGLCS